MEHDGQDWVARVTKVIGERIAYYRDRTTDEHGRKLTAQGLADRCKDLGLRIDRPAIAKLERGLRQGITVAELVVLATALDVAPALLMYPLGVQSKVEVTPGNPADPLTAILWLCGQDRDFPGTAAQKGGALDLFMLHRRTQVAMLGTLPRWHPLRSSPPSPDKERLDRDMAYHQAVLQVTRAAIRQLGLTPPELPSVLAWAEENREASDGVD